MKARRKPKTHAFTLLEVMLAVSILAILLASVGLATHGAINSYNENVRIAQVTQAARAVLTRMAQEIRTADSVENITSSRVAIFPPAGGSANQIFYELSGGTFYRKATPAGSPAITEPTYEDADVLLASDGVVTVTGFALTKRSGLDWQQVTCTKSMKVAIQLQVAGKGFSVTTTVCPRRNQLY